MKKEDYIIRNEEIKNMGLTDIHEATNTLNNKKYLCKVIRMKKENKEELKYVIEAIKIHHNIDNENIVSIYDHIEGQKNIYIFYEYIEGRTLKQLMMEKEELFEEYQIYYIFKRVYRAVVYIMELDTILKGLSWSNIFITKDNRVLLCDLEGKKLLRYSQPNKKFKLDVYFNIITMKLGIILCKLLNKDFSEFLTSNKIKNVKENHLELINKYIEKEILIRNDISSQLKDLIVQLLKDENNRIKITNIENHQWFQLFEKKKINHDNNKTKEAEKEKEIKIKRERQQEREKEKEIEKEREKEKETEQGRQREREIVKEKRGEKNMYNKDNNISENITKRLENSNSFISSSVISSSNTIDEINAKNKSSKQKEIKIEKIITDEAYLEYYKKERELLLGLIDSFDENEINKNMILAEKFREEKAKNENNQINENLMKNSINDDDNSNNSDFNRRRRHKRDDERVKTGFLSPFVCY